MSEILEKIGKLNPNIRIGISVGIYVAIFALFFVMLYKPKQETLSSLESTKRQLEAEAEDKKRKAENKKKFEEDLLALQEELETMVSQLPAEEQIPSLLDSVSQVGRKLGLDFAEWKSMSPVQKQYYVEVPVRIVVDGSFHDIALFFDKISGLERIVNVRDIDMGDPVEQSGKMMLRTEAEIVAFRQLTAAEQRQAIEGDDTAPVAGGGRR